MLWWQKFHIGKRMKSGWKPESLSGTFMNDTDVLTLQYQMKCICILCTLSFFDLDIRQKHSSVLFNKLDCNCLSLKLLLGVIG